MRRSTIASIFALALIALTSARSAHADAPAEKDNDFLFPGAGQLSLTGTTGLPFAALGEVSVGLGDRAALGGLVTGGPFLGDLATGLNPRVDLFHVGPMRFVLEAPVIWYPDIENTNNWIVARPDVRAEAKLGHFRLHVSGGLMYAKMVGADPVAGPIAPYGGGGLPSGVQEGAVWNTAGGGVAYALSPRTSVFTEGFLIMKGTRLAGPDWFDLPLGTFLSLSQLSPSHSSPATRLRAKSPRAARPSRSTRIASSWSRMRMCSPTRASPSKRSRLLSSPSVARARGWMHGRLHRERRPSRPT